MKFTPPVTGLGPYPLGSEIQQVRWYHDSHRVRTEQYGAEVKRLEDEERAATAAAEAAEKARKAAEPKAGDVIEFSLSGNRYVVTPEDKLLRIYAGISGFTKVGEYWLDGAATSWRRDSPAWKIVRLVKQQ